ncbi:MAG: histidine--tRNA ligase [Clostridia bacterium]|nr:histidine--tRNA ligase [Clostridia bacterium]
MKISAPKGTHDILPTDVHIWQYVEKNIYDICQKFGYNEIRFPVFEQTELFNRGVGDTTDVVQKEMYTFNDKGDRSITLRPEGTASTVRSYLENNLFNTPAPVKLFYIITCYRYERPQAGRYREFRQFGVENFGSSNPLTDAEVISLAMNLLNKLGIEDLTLYINSIGCSSCRKKYNELLKSYLQMHSSELCDLCNDRVGRNPLRVLDCKNPECHDVICDAPTVDTVLCDDCKNHFEVLKQALDSIGVKYTVDNTLVRGLDYYTKTVFEIKSSDLGAQSTVCGGGRYDGLVEQLGGSSTPGIGFSVGLERLIDILTKKNLLPKQNDSVDLFVASIGDNASQAAFKLVNDLRNSGVSAEFDHLERSVKAQLKYADKTNAGYSTVLGDDEISSGVISVKNMNSGEVRDIKIEDLTAENLNF